MTMRKIIIPGTAETALGKQIGGALFPFWSEVEALWLLGNSYHLGAPSEGAPMTDLSGNGHTLSLTSNAQVGARFQDDYFVGNGNNYLTTSFTGDELADDYGTPGEFGIIAWGLAIPTENNDFAMNNHSAGSFGNRYVQLRAATNFDCSATWHDGVEADTPAFSAPVDADRATKYRSWAAGWRTESTLLGYDMIGRERGFAETRNDNIGVSSAPGGNTFRIAFSGTGGLNFNVAGIAFLNKFPNSGKLKAIDTAFRPIFEAQGLSFT